MTTCLGKTCSFCLPCMSFENSCYAFPFGFEGGIQNLIVLIPDHCLTFFTLNAEVNVILDIKLYLGQHSKKYMSTVKISLSSMVFLGQNSV